MWGASDTKSRAKRVRIRNARLHHDARRSESWADVAKSSAHVAQAVWKGAHSSFSCVSAESELGTLPVRPLLLRSLHHS